MSAIKVNTTHRKEKLFMDVAEDRKPKLAVLLVCETI